MYVWVEVVESLDEVVWGLEESDYFFVAAGEDFEGKVFVFELVLVLILQARDAVDIVAVDLRSGDLVIARVTLLNSNFC